MPLIIGSPSLFWGLRGPFSQCPMYVLPISQTFPSALLCGPAIISFLGFFWLFIYFHILLRKGESTFVFGLAVLVVWRRLPASVIRVLGLSVYHHQGFQ